MTLSSEILSNPRFELMQKWLHDGLGLSVQDIVPAAADASTRRYWRIFVDGTSRIVMDAPSDGFHFDPFLAQHARLSGAGVPVPELFAHDAGQGFALLEDLGDATLTPLLTRDAAKDWYIQAIDLLVHMQARVDARDLPPYDAAFLQRELEICREWYLGRQLGVSMNEEMQAVWSRSSALIVTRNLQQPTGFVHRDYHSRNLMVKEDKLRLIDYQDAVHGPLSYDLVSLLRDAYIDWDESFVIDLAIRYWEKARSAGLPLSADFSEFYRDFEWQGLQRHLKVLGIFARLKFRDGKEQYQADIPRVLDYVYKVCERYIELGALRRLLARIHEEKIDVGYTF